MSEYIKFWIAQSLAPFVILLAIAAIIGALVGVLVIVDKFNKWRNQ